MKYLERNAAIIADLQGRVATPDEDRCIGAGTTMAAYASGSHDTTLAGALPVVVKTFIKPIRDRPYSIESATGRFARGLAYTALIDEHLPEFSPLLPRVYGMTADKNGIPTGQVMEDFSGGGARNASDYSDMPYWRPADVNDIFRVIGNRLKDLIDVENDPEFAFAPNDGFIAHSLNEVDDLGPRFVDLYGEPIGLDPYQRTRMSERPRATNKINELLGAQRIINSLGDYTIRLAD